MLLIKIRISIKAISTCVLKSFRFYADKFRNADNQRISEDKRLECMNNSSAGSCDFEFIETQNESIRITDSDLISNYSSLYHQLHNAFNNERLYLNPELDINSIVKVLGTNKKYLYYAMNANSKDNFRNFVNRYRIEEAKRNIELKIQQKEKLNISELYLSTGFSSPVTFYRAFKSITGLTPKEYGMVLSGETENNQLSLSN